MGDAGQYARWAWRRRDRRSASSRRWQARLPREVPRDHIVELPWALTCRFNPLIRAQYGPALTRLRSRPGIPQHATVAVSRAASAVWHGCPDLRRGRQAPRRIPPRPLFPGNRGGPERHNVKLALRDSGAHFVFTGPQAHERMPALLALADIGVAVRAATPTRRCASLASTGRRSKFSSTWQAAAVVTIDIPPLNRIVREAHEGLLYPAGDPERPDPRDRAAGRRGPARHTGPRGAPARGRAL